MKSSVKRMRNSVTFLVIGLMLGAAPGAAGQSQEFDPGFYESTLTGVQIEVSGPAYAITNVELQHYPEGEGEVVGIDSEVHIASLEVSFFDDPDTPLNTIDIYLGSVESLADEFEVRDRGTIGEVHYALAVMQYDGVDLVYFMQVREDVVGNTDIFEAILTSPLTFEEELTDAQSEITIDGSTFMAEFDPAEVNDVVTAGSSLSDEDAGVAPVEPVETVTFTQTAATVSIGPDFTFLGEPEVRQGIEAVRIQGPESLSMIAIGKTGDAPDQVMDSFQDGIASEHPDAERVYEEILDGRGWRILWIPKDDATTTYMVIVVDTETTPGMELMQAHEVSANTVESSILDLQSQVWVDDVPVMPEIDAEEMAFYVNQHVEQVGGVDTTVATAEPEDEEGDEQKSGNSRDGAHLPTDEPDATDETDGLENTSETGETVETTPEGIDENATPADDPPGVLTDSSWEGGVFGHLIEWDPQVWNVDVDYPDDLVSDEANQVDTIVLQASGESGTTWLYINVYGDDGSSATDYSDFWISDEYLALINEDGTNAEVLDFRTRGGGSGVVIRYSSISGDEMAMIHQAVALEDGSLIIITLIAPMADAVEMYDLALDVTFDSDQALQVFSGSQIQRTIGD